MFHFKEKAVSLRLVHFPLEVEERCNREPYNLVAAFSDTVRYVIIFEYVDLSFAIS